MGRVPCDCVSVTKRIGCAWIVGRGTGSDLLGLKQTRSAKAQSSDGPHIQNRIYETKSIASIAALFGVVVSLKASALAGPDLQLVSSLLRSAPTEKSVPTIALMVNGRLGTTAKPVTKPAAKTDATPFYVSGPHGDRYLYRR